MQSANAFRSVESDEVQKLSITLLKDGHCLIFFVMLMELKRDLLVLTTKYPPPFFRKKKYNYIYSKRWRIVEKTNNNLKIDV